METDFATEFYNLMKIFLTGGTGFLGNNVLRQLLCEGHQCVVATRASSSREPLRALNVETCNVDLTSRREVDRYVRDADVVIHSAAKIHIGWTKIEQSMNFNVDSTQALAETASEHGKRMVFVSTVDTLAAATSSTDLPTENDRFPAKTSCAYVLSKRKSEEAFRDQISQGLDGIIIHPGFMIGPLDWKPSSGRMLLSVARNFCPVAPAGGCSVVDVRDVARGLINAVHKANSGESFILAGENMAYETLWSKFAVAVGKRPPSFRLPDFAANAVGLTGDLWTKLSGRETDLNSAATKMGQQLHWYSSQKAMQQIGYRVDDVDVAINDAVRWFRERGLLTVRECVTTRAKLSAG